MFTSFDLANAERDDPSFDNAETLNDWNVPLQIFPEQHSTDAKSFFGTTIPTGSQAEAGIGAALDHIMAHPNLASFDANQVPFW